jgi:1-acyl-sn-glycerol-3-phosphate acyltransferase
VPAALSDRDPSRKDSRGAFQALHRLTQVFASILHYHRKAARCAASHGGDLPQGDLKGLITSWSNQALPLLNLDLERVGAIAPLTEPTLFVGNHLSYLDIPVLMSQVPVVFLGKAEIAKWPILGSAGRLAGMVFVKRESDGSRREATKAVIDCLQTRGMSLGIFPAGTTTLDEERPWRPGAFRIAKAASVPIQPFRLSYEPLAQAAFVGQDALLPHLLRLLRTGPITTRIEFGEPRLVQDPQADAQACWAWSRATDFHRPWG